jgi:formylglycine-generating enzyme required for sulfatase activity
MFLRSYDGVTYTDAGSPATVSAFRLDKYEVTVGRFRQFIAAVVGGWLPAPGSGRHAHLNGGQGLVSATGGNEVGWNMADDANLPRLEAAWDTALQCDSTYQTWTPARGANENLPITCETWSQAYAFCIYDGGFLPSEAEWNFAAAGGGGSGGQRAYPWSVPSTDVGIDCAHANYDPSPPCVAAGASAVGSDSPAGDGAFGQADLAGNLWEWNLDWGTAYVTPCVDCAYVKTTPFPPLRVLRGGARDAVASEALVSSRFGFTPEQTSATFGVRCARSP